jgi:hypothetical protein
VPVAINLVGILLIASAFPLAQHFRGFTSKFKRRWQEVAAGVAVSYVFIHVMPELEEHRQIVAGSAIKTLFNTDRFVYLWALAGFLFFTGLSRLQPGSLPKLPRSHHGVLVFWSEIAGYDAYALLIGYLLTHREDATLLSLGLFVAAMLLHLFVVDNELVEKFHDRYEARGRILLASGLLLGWMLGSTNALPESFTSRMFAFVTGGVVITTAHQQLPAEEDAPFCWWFIGGAAIYSSLLLLI